MPKNKRIAVSGGFDPVHIGHIRMFREAAKLGTLYVILNSDDFLLKKKGKVFMPFAERKEILENIDGVYEVVECIDEDMTVCDTLRLLKPDVFANGGDRIGSNTPEKEVCDAIGIQMLYNIGGEKVQSSSDLVSSYDCK